ncbi:hypothetical protein KCP74_04685 [Salmonella enterica subsp. enterica]|nr:hypothetical protein KCP74_04685 [Salmonella enterica subsp. enterica]
MLAACAVETVIYNAASDEIEGFVTVFAGGGVCCDSTAFGVVIKSTGYSGVGLVSVAFAKLGEYR